MKLEWVYDSAWRFYPVEPDPELGYRLHYFDAATNKLLALSGRAEPGISWMLCIWMLPT